MVKKKSPHKLGRLERNLAKAILQYIQGKRYSPMTKEELKKELSIPDSLEQAFLSALRTLEKEKEIICRQERFFGQDSRSDLAIGLISIHPIKGFGFVKVPKESKEIFIPKHLIGEAVDGDRVEVEITEVSLKGPEGRIIAIVERSRSHLACTILEAVGGRFLAYSPLLGPKKAVLIEKDLKESLREGDRVICRVLSWNNEEDAVLAVLTRRIGHISDPSCDIPAAIEEFGLPDGFTIEAIEEAKSFGTRVSAKGRLDLSADECVTIDPDTAKDFDDAISLTKDERGHFLLGVHIADVAAYVKRGSHLDREAYLRCNSTYFPGFCLPMLPEALSNELCSLKPNVKRLAASVLAEFDPAGNLVDYKIERTCIKSKKRFTYGQAFALLEKKESSSKKDPFLPLLERMVELCYLFKAKRRERGSIDFSLVDSMVVIDPKGVPQRIEHIEYDITHQMIEEFMLKANEIVSTHLSKTERGQIYRIHEEPAAESFEDFYTYARSLGFSLPKAPKHSDIQHLFEQAKNSPYSHQLSVGFIRSMKLAFYSPDNIGHYGLALPYYSHFTSPIRRYTDLVIQRLLFKEEAPEADLAQIAKTCSEKERLSMRAESSVIQLKKLRLAASAFANDPEHVYSAVVTRVKPFALFFEIPDFAIEGSLHVSELGNDFFEYNPKTLSFFGKRTGKTFACGELLFIRLAQIDLIRQQAVWKTVSPPAATRKKKR